jgi:hypothetical protein
VLACPMETLHPFMNQLHPPRLASGPFRTDSTPLPYSTNRLHVGVVAIFPVSPRRHRAVPSRHYSCAVAVARFHPVLAISIGPSGHWDPPPRRSYPPIVIVIAITAVIVIVVPVIAVTAMTPLTPLSG